MKYVIVTLVLFVVFGCSDDEKEPDEIINAITILD